MNSYNIVQFITLVVYLVLITIVVVYVRTKLRPVFLVYLIASVGWSLSSFLAHSEFLGDAAVLWIKFVPFTSSWTIVAYAHFVSLTVQKWSRAIFRAGYGFLFVLSILIALGYIPRNILNLGTRNIYNDYGPWLYFLTAAGVAFVGVSIFLLVKSYRASGSPEQRNRIIYLLAGVSLLIIFGTMFELLSHQRYALDHFGHLGNALVLTYALLRNKLLDAKMVLRRGLAYSGVTVAITAMYLVILTVTQHFLESWANMANIVTIIIMAVLMALLLSPIRKFAQKWADRLFYGESYDYREMIRTFSERKSNVLDLNELAIAMLQPIVRAIGAGQASLLLPNGEHFTSQFAERLTAGEPVTPLRLRDKSQIVAWLRREDKALTREAMEIEPEFKGLWEAERKIIEGAEVELFCPIKSKHTLVGILAVSRKHPRGAYSNDDVEVLMTLANDAAVVIENAQLYAQAKQRANTDELTGLFNHRYFHQRLDEEIARCSRFGNTFSLIFLDLDLFKTYNDVYGHLAGDEILKQVSFYIRAAIRNIDIAFRYGGDEFAVLLPQTSAEGSYRVAERIRKGIEMKVDTKGIPLTCSVGIASWPKDGVMREELVHTVDAALYFAKEIGRNRISIASDVALSEATRVASSNTENKSVVLSTIYALAATVDAKDHYTYGHSKKVAKYATDIAEALGHSKEKLETIRAAALLHDIGKIGISDDILEKPGPLTEKEWEPIHNHPSLGVAIIKHVDALKDCLAAIQHHHERYDGKGYPTGLKGDNIPLDARIIAVADSFDAMTSLRPYRDRALTLEEGIRELQRCAGKQFDPTIVTIFANLSRPTIAEAVKTRDDLLLEPK